MTSNNTKKNNEKFIEKAKDKFGDKFDYSKFIYTNTKTKGIILCPIHGEFLKVGITTINPKNRGNSIKSKSKNFDIIYTEEMSLYDAFLKEESILNEYSNKRVFTKWTTELFSEDVLNKDKHEYIWEKSISILGL